VNYRRAAKQQQIGRQRAENVPSLSRRPVFCYSLTRVCPECGKALNSRVHRAHVAARASA
jgi:hypothetical protein